MTGLDIIFDKSMELNCIERNVTKVFSDKARKPIVEVSRAVGSEFAKENDILVLVRILPQGEFFFYLDINFSDEFSINNNIRITQELSISFDARAIITDDSESPYRWILIDRTKAPQLVLVRENHVGDEYSFTIEEYLGVR